MLLAGFMGACSKRSLSGYLEVLRVLPSSTCEEGFFHLKDFWNKIWARPVEIPELLTLNQQKVNEQWRMPLLLEDWIPEVDEFAALARASSGASAGCDGWCGSELAAMPEEVFQTFHCTCATLEFGWRMAGRGHMCVKCISGRLMGLVLCVLEIFGPSRCYLFGTGV